MMAVKSFKKGSNSVLLRFLSRDQIAHYCFDLIGREARTELRNDPGGGKRCQFTRLCIAVIVRDAI